MCLGFMLYCLAAIVFSTVMIYKVAPVYGKKNPLIYISICSTVGSISVMSVKAFGIALKLTMAGNNQFTHPSTWAFAIVTVVCILTQMNYFNKALSQFSTSIVNPLYYVTFTTATLCASFILFRGFNTSDAINTLSLLCGFLVIFSGVYLLNLSRGDPEGHHLLNGKFPDEDGIPTDAFSSLATRSSMSLRRSSLEQHRRSASLTFDPHRRSGSLTFSPGGNRISSHESAGLIRSYDVEQGAFGLSNLVEDPEDTEGESTSRRDSGEHVTRIKAPVSRKGTKK